MRRLAPTILLLWLASCGDDTPIPTDGGPGDLGQPAADSGPDGGPALPEVVWEPCPEGFQTDCATLQMPLDHTDPSSPTIDVFISRRTTGGLRQLWLLQGGPGASAADLLPFTDLFPMLDPTLEVYTIEHRGVGRSTRLTCAQEDPSSEGGVAITDAEWPDCIADLEAQWGDDLQHFDTQQAAHDLALAIEATRGPDQDVFVWGGSYGSYWANRYAVLHPDQPAGVMLDAPVQPGTELDAFSTQFDPVGRIVFEELCPAAEVCAEKLGDDPLAFVANVLSRIDDGHCGELGYTALDLSNAFGLMLMNWALRDWIPAFVYRLDRCDAADRAAIEHFVGLVFGSDELTEIPNASLLLQSNVILGELWPEGGADGDAVAAELEGALFRQDGIPHLYAIQDRWPAYEPEPEVSAYAPPSVPMLAMAGELDPATPPDEYAAGYAANLTGPSQSVVEIPWGTHSVITSGPIPGALPCPMQLFVQFVREPSGELDTSCLDEIVAPSFAQDASTTMTYWGTPDLYENP